MDNSNLIDLNKDECEGGKKLTSPLIPLPPVNDRRLSDVDNNPFDKVLRTISNKNDPFECVFEAMSLNNNKKLNLNDFENKENVGFLISPIQTPVKLKKHKKLTSSPLFLDSNSPHGNFNSLLPIVSKLQNSSLECNISNVSLQILSDSVLNLSDINNSFQLALNLPLPSDSSDDDILNGCQSDGNQFIFDIPAVVVNSDGKESSSTNVTNGNQNSGFNNAFIDNSSRLSIKSVNNANTPTSFNTASLGKSEISNIFPSTSSNNSAEMPSTNPLNDAFINDSPKSINAQNMIRKCMSARKPKNSTASNIRHLNNSFGGFNANDDILNPYKFCKKHDNDSVFLEGCHLAQSFRVVPPIDLEDEAIAICTPPWLEEKISFAESDDDDDDETDEKENKIFNENEIEIEADEKNNVEGTTNNVEEKNKVEEKNHVEELNSSDVENDEKDDSDVQNAKDLLQNLSKILNKSGDVKDQRTLGENLLNSLALALNIDSRNLSGDNKESNSFKMQRSKSDSKVNEKIRQINTHIEKKVNVPKLKIQSVAPVKLDKNLKPKSEKEKVTGRGPLKALLPLANVTKAKNNGTNSILTPPKNSQGSLQYQLKKTSTPNETKLKSPIAQSTPDIYYKKSSNEPNKITPVSKRQFGFSLSPLARPASSNDISNISLNKSISPKQNSSSIPNLNTSLNKSGTLVKSSSNSSIPTITRRNSITEINSTRNTFNRSFDNNKPARTSQLKRSSSFQSKTNSMNARATATLASTPTPTVTTTIASKNTINNNNTVKKYGIPGKIKPLKLVPKTKKNVGE